MSSTIKIKTFIQALKQFRSNTKLFKNFLTDKRLTQDEKKILTAWLLVRDKKISEAIVVLQTVEGAISPIVLAQKNLLLGICFNNKSEYHKSLSYFEASLGELSHQDLQYFSFIAFYNIFISNWNLRNIVGMTDALKKMNCFEQLDQQEKLRLKSCQCIYHIFQNDLMKSEECINELNPHIKTMDEALKANYFILKFNLFLKLGSFDRCQKVLKEMKDIRKFQTSANFNFMTTLLNHLTGDEPIYYSENIFKDHPFLYWQMKVIQNLEKTCIHDARKAWNELKELDPRLYEPNFNFTGDKCLFSLALEKHLWKVHSPEQNISNLPPKKEEAFVTILQNAERPLTKEEVYQMIWQSELVDKADFDKLKKLASRLIKKGIPIIYSRGCYSLKENTKKSA
jgi:tetratricopeptide (TPR) repeat protein